MAVFLNSDALATRYVPGPSMERGHALSVYPHPSEPRLVYAFGKFVVVRSLDDSADNFVYRGHKYAVKCCAFSPNGYWVASGDEAGFLRVWSWDNPEHVLKIEVQVFAGAIKDLCWDGESKKIALVGDGKGVVAKCVVWDTGNSCGAMVGHSKRAPTVAYRQQRPFRILTGSEDFKTCFYKGPPFKLDHSDATHRNYVNCVRYAKDGSLAASCGSDKKILLYEGAEGAVVRECDGKEGHPKGSVYSIAFSDDGASLLAASADKSLSVFATGDGSMISTTAMGADVGDMQMCALYVRDRALSFSLSGDLNYLDVTAAGCAVSRVVQAPQAPVSAMAVCGDATVVAGCNDGTVFTNDGREWRKVVGAVKGSYQRAAHGGKVTAVAGLDGGGFASAGYDDAVRFCADGAAYGACVAVEGQPVGLAALEGGAVAFATTKGVGVAAAAGVSKFESTAWDPTAVAAAPGGAAFAVGAKDGTIRVFSAAVAETKVLPAHRGAVTALAYSPDGAKLAAGDADREIKVYDATSYAVLLQNLWRYHTARVTAVAWDPTSSYLSSTSLDESIFVWSLADPQKSAHKYDFTHKDGTVALAYKGAQVVSAGNDGCVCVWNV